MMETVKERFRRSTKHISDLSDDRGYQRTLAHRLSDSGSVATGVKRRIEAVELYELSHLPRTVY
jgi:hypothetical protein